MRYYAWISLDQCLLLGLGVKEGCIRKRKGGGKDAQQSRHQGVTGELDTQREERLCLEGGIRESFEKDLEFGLDF